MREVNPENAPAFYALARGGAWKDYLNLLHLPYTGWHLSYIVLGAALAPTIQLDKLLATLLGFFLAVGIAAHAFDELNGRPLNTTIPRPVLAALAAVSLGGAVALGIISGLTGTIWTFPFVAFGGFIVIAYNLELWKGRFHSDIWFAAAWGAFPAITSYWVQAETLTAASCLLALGCFAFSLSQRTLSTEVRNIRRHTRVLRGSMETWEGQVVQLSRFSIIAAPERALGLLSVTAMVLAAGLLVARY